MKEQIEKLNILYKEYNIIEPNSKTKVDYDGLYQLRILSKEQSIILKVGNRAEIKAFIDAQLALFDSINKIRKSSKIFRVEVAKTLSKTVEVNAANKQEAIEKVQQLYNNKDITVDSNDPLNITIQLDTKDLDAEKDSFRICDKCGCKMKEGYLIEGIETYCSEECLKDTYSKKDIDSFDIGGDDSDSYYTEW